MPEGDLKLSKLTEVVNTWKSKNFILPIEDISKDLYTVYTYEELLDIEFEYLASRIAKVLGFEESDKYLKVLDNNFFPKLDCVLAILKNPYELTDDLTAFVNTILVCNDAPLCGDDIVQVTPHFIERGLYAINKILPEDMDLADVFWQANIQHYIFMCYNNDTCYMLPKMIDYMEEDMFRATLQSDDVRKVIRDQNTRLRTLAHDIAMGVKDNTEAIAKAFSDNSESNPVNDIMKAIEDSPGMSESDRLALTKYMRSYIYKRFYRQLMPTIEDYK